MIVPCVVSVPKETNHWVTPVSAILFGSAYYYFHNKSLLGFGVVMFVDENCVCLVTKIYLSFVLNYHYYNRSHYPKTQQNRIQSTFPNAKTHMRNCIISPNTHKNCLCICDFYIQTLKKLQFGVWCKKTQRNRQMKNSKKYIDLGIKICIILHCLATYIDNIATPNSTNY